VNCLLLVEDQPSDLKIATSTARAAGISVVEAQTSLLGARSFLERGLRGEIPLPDGIVLDLDLGYESGFELLRFWHSTPRLSSIPLLVWSILGQEQREICSLFKVSEFVSKWEGMTAFREALERLRTEN
jgi:DNA-binding response OmpR family regulator